MSTRTCWRVEVEFDTGVRNAYSEPAYVREWVRTRLAEGGHGYIENVRVVSLIIQKPLLPNPPNPTVKRKLKR